MNIPRDIMKAPPGLERVRRIYATWGRHPGVYAAQDWITFLGRHRLIRQRAAEALQVRRGARVLEVGCGTGRNFEFVQDRIGSEGSLVGFDYSPEMLAAAGELCRQQSWHNVELVQGDAATLDIGEEPFDGVLAVLALSAMPDPVAVLRRCQEVLRPGGRLAVCDARLPDGALGLLNPLLRAVYVRLAAWDPDRSLPDAMEATFGNVFVDRFNLGTLYIATAARPEPETARA